MRTRTALPPFFVLLLPLTSVATARFYPDQEAVSPNGRYQATARSPDNRQGHFPFAAAFTTTLRDTQAGKVIWSYNQKEDEASPTRMHPTDAGYLVMQDAWDTYHVFDKNGAPRKVVAILDCFAKREKKKFTSWTTAGVMWQQFSREGFFGEPGTRYFYLRTYWGRIIAIDIANAKRVSDGALLARVEGHVVEEVRQLIEAFDDKYYADCESCGGRHLREDLTQAAFVIKQHGLSEGKQLLSEILQRCNDDRNADLPGYLEGLGGPLHHHPGKSVYILVAAAAAVTIALGAYVKRMQKARRAGPGTDAATDPDAAGCEQGLLRRRR